VPNNPKTKLKENQTTAQKIVVSLVAKIAFSHVLLSSCQTYRRVSVCVCVRKSVQQVQRYVLMREL